MILNCSSNNKCSLKIQIIKYYVKFHLNNKKIEFHCIYNNKQK